MSTVQSVPVVCTKCMWKCILYMYYKCITSFFFFFEPQAAMTDDFALVANARPWPSLKVMHDCMSNIKRKYNTYYKNVHNKCTYDAVRHDKLLTTLDLAFNFQYL